MSEETALQRAFRRYDETPDGLFYATPRLVTHIDDAAIAAVTQLYRELFPPGGRILDLMSSWVSHLPPEVTYRRVAGLGMNQEELDANPRLTDRFVHDLNQLPELPFADGEFDGAGICVSIQYLIHPVEVLREVGRVLRVGAPLVVTFSNRCFPTKAVGIWLALDDAGHGSLIQRYLEAAGNWSGIELWDRSPDPERSDPLYAVVARSLGPDRPRPQGPRTGSAHQGTAGGGGIEGPPLHLAQAWIAAWQPSRTRPAGLRSVAVHSIMGPLPRRRSCRDRNCRPCL